MQLIREAAKLTPLSGSVAAQTPLRNTTRTKKFTGAAGRVELTNESSAAAAVISTVPGSELMLANCAHFGVANTNPI